MALNCSDIVPEPFGNLVDRNACARQEAGESMPHDMRRHPRDFFVPPYSGRTACRNPTDRRFFVAWESSDEPYMACKDHKSSKTSITLSSMESFALLRL
jgi:hypothetical protein